MWKQVVFSSSCLEVSFEYVCISLYYRVKLDPLLRCDLSEDPIKYLLYYIVSVLWLMGMLPVFIPIWFICGSLLRLSHVWLCDPNNGSLPGSSVHGIFQTRILEWVATSFSRGSSRPRDWTWVFHIGGRRFTDWATWEVKVYVSFQLVVFPGYMRGGELLDPVVDLGIPRWHWW